MIDLDELVLPDDYKIYGDYLYVVDGEVYRSDWHNITVRELKIKLRREGRTAIEIRRCDMVGRGYFDKPIEVEAPKESSFTFLTMKENKKINRPSKRTRFQRKAAQRRNSETLQ